MAGCGAELCGHVVERRQGVLVASGEGCPGDFCHHFDQDSCGDGALDHYLVDSGATCVLRPPSVNATTSRGRAKGIRRSGSRFDLETCMHG